MALTVDSIVNLGSFTMFKLTLVNQSFPIVKPERATMLYQNNAKKYK